MSWNISYFVDQLPLDFDEWNSTARQDYYTDNLYGYSDLPYTDQESIAGYFTRDDIVNLWNAATVGDLGYTLERGLNATTQYLEYIVNTYLRSTTTLSTTTTAGPPNPCDEIEDRQKTFILIMAAPAAVIVLLMSFLKKRRNLCLGCLGGRPGLQYPINFIDDTRRRWAYMAAFAVIAYRIMEIFQGGNFYIPDAYSDPDFTKTWGWTRVLITLMNVIVLGIVYYPLLVCVTLRKYLVMNILGLLYIGAWIALLGVIYHTCPPTDKDEEHRSRSILQITFDVPVFIAYVVLIAAYILDLVRNIIKLYKKFQAKNKAKYLQEEYKHEFFGSRPIKYLEALLSREERVPDEELSFFQRLKRKFSYERTEGFLYSPRILCTMVVVFFFLYKLHTVIDFYGRFFHTLGKDLLTENREFLEEDIFPNSTIVHYVFQGFEVLYWSFFASTIASLLLHLIFMFHILVTYRKHMTKLLKGDIKWHYKTTNSPASQMVAGMRYSGYQIAYMFYGYIILFLVMWIACILVAYLLILPLVEGFPSPLIDQIKTLWPSILFGILIWLSQLLMAKFCFLQQRGAYMALNNRRLYHIVSFYLFFFNVVLGLFSCLKRILMSMVFGLILLSRLDRCLLMRGFERFDAGYAAYLGMLEVEIYHAHPLLKAFIMILEEEAQDSKMRHSSTDDKRPNKVVPEIGYSNGAMKSSLQIKSEKTYDKRIVVKWWKMVTLVHNPSLILERMQANLKAKKKLEKSVVVDGMIEAAAATGAGFIAVTGLSVGDAVGRALDEVTTAF